MSAAAKSKAMQCAQWRAGCVRNGLPFLAAADPARERKLLCMAEDPQFLTTPGGASLAYHCVPGRSPTVVFLSGFASHMGGTKAIHLERWCRARGQACLRLDYQGHGRSSGRFEDGTLGVWADDALAVIEGCTRGPLLLVGSSMGAWIMLIVARLLQPRISALLGIASAPDFTEELIHAQLDAEQRARLNRDGRLERVSAYDQGPNVVTLQMIEDGRKFLQLGEIIPIECPVRLIHGLEDPDVPWEISLRLCDRLESQDVRVILVKGGGHRLSEPADLELITETLSELLARGEAA
jgi:pimeloyl-ACP methyl ester carboxylesterase